MEIFRFTIAGSVDDGKSTMVGRLLLETKNIKKDILEEIALHSADVNLAHVTDGLRTERQNGITVDVAYKYFYTSGRKYILSDAPGHFQYVRNLVSGAAMADAMIILIDATQGITLQTKRHLYVAAFLRIRHVAIAINKMDLVGYSEERFSQLKEECLKLMAAIQLSHSAFIPTSGLLGENITNASVNMNWFGGSDLMQFLERCSLPLPKPSGSLRCCVQLVLHTKEHHTLAMVRLLSGSLSAGFGYRVFPRGNRVVINRMFNGFSEVQAADAGDDLCLALDSSGITRGDVLCEDVMPSASTVIEAELCWFDDARNLQTNRRYLLQVNSSTVLCVVTDILNVFDPNDLSLQKNAAELSLNEFGRVIIQTDLPIYHDVFDVLPEAGRGILIDTETNYTCAAAIFT